MKNFLVTNSDVNTLATFAANHRLGGVTLRSAPDTALALWSGNLESVSVVWGKDARSDWGDLADLKGRFVYTPRREEAPLVHYIAQSYARQCEAAPDWDTSSNRALAEQIRQHAARIAEDADSTWDADARPWSAPPKDFAAEEGLARLQHVDAEFERSHALARTDPDTAFGLGMWLAITPERREKGLELLRKAEQLGHPRARLIIDAYRDEGR